MYILLLFLYIPMNEYVYNEGAVTECGFTAF